MTFKIRKGNKKSVTILDASGEEKEKFEILDEDKDDVEDQDKDEEITDEDLSKEEEEYVYDADEIKEVADMCKDMGYETMKDMAEACKSYKDAETDSDVLDEDVEDEDKDKDKKDDEKTVLDELNGGEKKLSDEAKDKAKKLADEQAEKAIETQKIVQAQYDSFSKPEKK